MDALARASGSRYSTHDVVGAGPRTIAGVIQQRGYDVELKSYELFMEKLVELSSYDMLLISIMSSDKGALGKVLERAIASKYEGVVVVGGPASFEYREILSKFKRVDYVIVGEGEVPISKILERPHALFDRDLSELRSIPALAFRLEREYALTTGHVRTPAELLSSVKPWTRVNASYKSYKVLRYYVEVLRGCSNYARPLVKVPGELECKNCMLCRSEDLERRVECPAGIPPGCGFCSVPLMFGPPRSRRVESVVEEVRDLIEHGARRIVLSAPDFLDYGRELLVKPKPLTNPCEPMPNLELIESLLEELHEIPSCRSGEAVVSIENIKACLVDERVAKVLGKYLKGTTVHIGLETGCNWYNDYVLGKPITVEQTIRAVKLLLESGLRPYIYAMYGLPFMNRKTYVKTLRALRKLSDMGVEKITLYKYVSLPASAFQNLKPSIDKYRELISYVKRRVDAYNLKAKRKFLGREIEVYIACSSGKCYGYPLKHGPVVFIKNVAKPKHDNCRGIVKIVDVGKRFVWGELVKVLSC